jgi:hypothetical protein
LYKRTVSNSRQIEIWGISIRSGVVVEEHAASQQCICCERDERSDAEEAVEAVEVCWEDTLRAGSDGVDMLFRHEIPITPRTPPWAPNVEE